MGGDQHDRGSKPDGGVKFFSGPIPVELVRFIQEHVSSLEQLEVICLLRNSAPREWRADEVSRELGSSLMSIGRRLEHLADQQFIKVRHTERGPVYQHGPESEDIAALIDAAARLYKERRLAVIDLVYGRPESDLRAFSDAFMLKKK
ncbi:hypothetical protein [Polyangium jinanense]|uniref:Uncharacterized protein n=1 Tax=Polyangium jinanense TaxID=2829994 RepID=A0A9X3XFJ1_9BACT|nr:hypothetical protein [Polyangium jinanense]MDC3962501.1 hypothetical protein [Polyangium jinanense]MDC3988450.1 hypothetical protein [Polyangium jinanense]